MLLGTDGRAWTPFVIVISDLKEANVEGVADLDKLVHDNCCQNAARHCDESNEEFEQCGIIERYTQAVIAPSSAVAASAIALTRALYSKMREPLASNELEAIRLEERK